LFSLLTKQYIGLLAQKMKGTPIERYFYPFYLIAQNSGKISQQELANQLFTDKVSIVRIVDSLTLDGLIERQTNPNDRRQHLLCVTEKGMPWVEIVQKALQECEDYYFQFLPPQERENLLANLQQMANESLNNPLEEIEILYQRVHEKK
jgi:MarR family transcriptional regulator for hemolysin